VPDSQQTPEGDEERSEPKGGEDLSEREKGEKAKEAYESAKEKIKELEEMDEPPTRLEDWPDDQAKYITYGGGEGDHSYAEGPESKLGPSDLERQRDGSVRIEGEEVDNPDDYKAEPIPGGPTDPDSPELRGEVKKREKMKATYGEEYGTTDAMTQKARGEAGESSPGQQEDPSDTSDDTSEDTSDDTSDDDADAPSEAADEQEDRPPPSAA
jgi:hypothetical protein